MKNSPYINRFLQPDSIIPNPANPQAFNRFSYVYNHPIIFTDPSGHDADYFCSGSNDTSSRCTGYVTDQANLGASLGRNVGSREGNNGDEQQEPNLDIDVEDWGTDSLDDEWREQRSEWVWNWLDRRGGFWGPGRPDLKTLITLLLIQEGSGLMNANSSNNRFAGLQVMVFYMQSLFDDENGITPKDLSAFTAFFNPKKGDSGAWNQADRDVYQHGYDANTWNIASGFVNTYWDSDPVLHNNNTVYKWWDNTENFAYEVAFAVDVPIQGITLYFGYP